MAFSAYQAFLTAHAEVIAADKITATDAIAVSAETTATSAVTTNLTATDAAVKN